MWRDLHQLHVLLLQLVIKTSDHISGAIYVENQETANPLLLLYL